jgi:non-heme chloroperoxidase
MRHSTLFVVVIAAHALLGLPIGRPLAAQQAVHVADAGERTRFSPLRHSRIQLATGVELELVQTGDAEGVPVLFLHGYTDSWFSFTRVLERLPRSVRAIVPSQRGHGRSSRPSCCYAPGDMAGDAIALLDALGVRRVVVVGHSLGSFVAQRLAAERPDRVAALVLIGSATTLGGEALVEFAEFVDTLEDPVPPEFIREFQESTVSVPLAGAFLAGVVNESGLVPARVWQGTMRGMLADPTVESLAEIRAPTLLVWGDEDGLFDRAEQDALLRAIPGARLSAYAATGHAPHWERPERFVEELAAFLAGAGAQVNGASRRSARLASAAQPSGSPSEFRWSASRWLHARRAPATSPVVSASRASSWTAAATYGLQPMK